MDTKTHRYITLFSASLIALAFSLNSPIEIKEGLTTILTSRSDLTTDFFALANPGSALLNGALLMLFANLYLQFFRVKLTGNAVCAIVLMMTYGLFGKNLFNSWPFVLGSLFYCSRDFKSRLDALPLGLLATGIAPLVSYFNPLFGIPVAFLFGYIIAPCAKQVLKLHRGLSLFNVGLTLGILGTLFYQCLHLFGITVEARFVITENSTLPLAYFMFLLFALMIFFGDHNCVSRIFKEKGLYLKDYYNFYGFRASLCNAGLNGLLALLAAAIIGAPINGVSSACIMIVSVFGFNGASVRTLLPIFLSFYLGHFLGFWNLASTQGILTMLLASSLSPFVGHYGILLGMIASLLVGFVSPITSSFHAGLSLLNTGFACGLVAAGFHFILDKFKIKPL